MLDRKFEPIVKKLMVKYLGELEDDDLVMFVLEHLKDHKSPQKLVEGLEPVRPPVHVDVSTNIARPSSLGFMLTFFYFCVLVTWDPVTRDCTGARRRSNRADDQRMAASHLREHGVRRGVAYGEDDG